MKLREDKRRNPAKLLSVPVAHMQGSPFSKQRPLQFLSPQ
jgi:hypothetical protein